MQRKPSLPGSVPGGIALACVVLLSAAFSAHAMDLAGDPGAACLEAAGDAQLAWQLPPDILAAIGRVESGRYDPMLGRIAPWPWTINALGRGQYFASKAEAIEAVEALQASGVDSIDVGCFQVNLRYHPEAFASLDQAFDPATNADYAARFLAELNARSGGWQTAVALYHSAWPAEGESYRQKVLVSLDGGGLVSGGALAGLFSHAPRRDRSAPGDPYVILISAAASSIKVYGPSGPIRLGARPPHPDLASAPDINTPGRALLPVAIGRFRPFRLPPPGRNGLPTVVTPRTPI